MEESVGNVSVVCRFRPLNEQEKLQGSRECVDFIDERSIYFSSGANSTFTFDHVFAPSASQSSVYNTAGRPIAQAVMEGFNGTVFAYGQTASGKTHTMVGQLQDRDNMGIAPRMVQSIFEGIDAADEETEFTVKVSYAEIYIERIRDLLDPSRSHLKVHEDRTRGMIIRNLTEHYVASQREVLEYMETGNNHRETATTKMNAYSSRSHAIFTLTVSQTNSKDLSAKTGKLHLVDLAGSEKVKKTGADGKRLEEAKNINKSLATLGHVIYSLTDGKSTYVPYRDSKLTRILQDSLGGNSKTALIMTCSPSVWNEVETLSTLNFGVRAKSIKNKPIVNREHTVAELKLLLANCQEDLRQMNKRVDLLEKTLTAQGLQIPTQAEHSSFSIPANLEDVKFEVIQELEHTRKVLSEVVEENRKLKMSGVQASQCEMHLKEVWRLREVTEKQQSELAVKEELVEKLRTEKKSLENDIEKLNEAVMNLERSMMEKSIQLEQALNKPKIEEIQKPVSEPSHLDTEFQELSQEIERLRGELHQALTHPEAENIKEIIKREEQKKWKVEKQQYAKALEKKVQLYISTFEAQINEAKENYLKLEQAMNDGEKLLILRNEAMERSLQQVMKMHKELSVQKAKLSAKQTYYKKKCAKYQEIVKEQGERLKQIEETVEPFEEKKNDTKVKRSIRGGQKNK